LHFCEFCETLYILRRLKHSHNLKYVHKQQDTTISQYELEKLCGTIIHDMAIYFDNCEVQKLACKAVHNIAKVDTAAGDYLGTEGACEAIVTAMMKYTDTNEEIVQYCWDAVYVLAQCESVHGGVLHDNTSRLCEAGVLELVVSTLQKYASSAHISTAVMRAAIHLMEVSDANTTAVMSNAGIYEAIFLLLKHAHDRELVIVFLKKLQITVNNSSDNIQKLIDGGACEVLKFMLTSRSGNADISVLACQTLQLIVASDISNARKLVEAGVFKSFITVLNTHADNSVF
jgi:hypothetical protein